uniref:Uncharacterized protein n=1 Tax=Arundo donax TaxID=35708 RepID=A0A0A8Y2E8_ARUDO
MPLAKSLICHCHRLRWTSYIIDISMTY